MTGLVFFISAFAFCGASTASPDQMLPVTPQMLKQLAALKPELNFGPDAKTYYTGVPDPVDRLAGDKAFSQLIDVLVSDLPKHSAKSFVLGQFKMALSKFSSVETEDRERAVSYCEKIMDVLGIANSDGVLNRWLYGPVLGRMVKAKQ
jgi:hypothetical protein